MLSNINLIYHANLPQLVTICYITLYLSYIVWFLIIHTSLYILRQHPLSPLLSILWTISLSKDAIVGLPPRLPGHQTMHVLTLTLFSMGKLQCLTFTSTGYTIFGMLRNLKFFGGTPPPGIEILNFQIF